MLGLFLDMDTYLIQKRHEILDWAREQPQAREGRGSVLHAVTFEKLRKRHQHEAFSYWELHPGPDWLVVKHMPRSCEDVPEQPLIFGVQPMGSGQRQKTRDQFSRVGVGQFQVAIFQVPGLRQEEHCGHMMTPQRPVRAR